VAVLTVLKQQNIGLDFAMINCRPLLADKHHRSEHDESKEDIFKANEYFNLSTSKYKNDEDKLMKYH